VSVRHSQPPFGAALFFRREQELCVGKNFRHFDRTTCSPCPFFSAKTVDNQRRSGGKIIDLSAYFALFTRCSQARSGEQAVHIKSLSVR
jgi:hypothetical protein